MKKIYLFLDMDGYGFFVWSAYAFWFFILILLIVKVIFRKRNIEDMQKSSKDSRDNKKEKNKGAMKGGKGEKEQDSSSTWQCPVCTYIHSFQEAAFLACKACGAERSGTCS